MRVHLNLDTFDFYIDRENPIDADGRPHYCDEELYEVPDALVVAWEAGYEAEVAILEMFKSELPAFGEGPQLLR